MDTFLTEIEVSKQLNITPSALRSRRREGNPPAFVKREGRVLYAKSTIEHYKQTAQKNLSAAFKKDFKKFNTDEWQQTKGFLKKYVDLLQKRSGVQNPIFLIPTALTTLQYGARNIHKGRPNLWMILGDQNGDGKSIRQLLEINHSLAKSLGIEAVFSHFYNEKTLNKYIKQHPNTLSIELDGKKMIKHLRGYSRHSFIVSMESLMCGEGFFWKNNSMARLRCFDQQDLQLFYDQKYSRCDAKHNYLCIETPVLKKPQEVGLPKNFKAAFDRLRFSFPKEYSYSPAAEGLFREISKALHQFVNQYMNHRLLNNGGGHVDTHSFVEFAFEKAMRIALVHAIFALETKEISEENLSWAISLMCQHLQTVFALEDQLGVF